MRRYLIDLGDELAQHAVAPAVEIVDRFRRKDREFAVAVIAWDRKRPTASVCVMHPRDVSAEEFQRAAVDVFTGDEYIHGAREGE